MADQKLYRKNALEKLASPEKLDKSLPVTKPLYWIATIGAVIVLVFLLVWGFFGNINITLDVPGACYTPGYANKYVCEDTGIVTSIYKDQGRFVKAGEPIYEYRDNVKTSEVKYWNSPVTGMISTMNIYPGSEIFPGKDSVTIKSFVNETKEYSQVIDVSSEHDPNNEYKNYTKKVYAFIPINNFSQVQPGLDVEVWPLSSDKYTHGHMVGKVTYVNAFIASDSDVKSIIGLDSKIIQFEQMGNVGICEIDLQADPNTASGYYWTSPNGASQTITEGDVVNASIIMGRVRPISLIFSGQ